MVCARGALRAGDPLPLQPASEPTAEGWQPLFDGKTTRGWRGYRQKSFPTQGWTVEDGCLKHTARGGGGDIVTERTFDEFEFEFEWRIGPKANSGVKYFVSEDRPSAIGHEYQILDDAEAIGAKPANKHQTASFYDVLAPTNSERPKPAGEFNRSRIVVSGQKVEHWLNGIKTIEYELGSESLRTAVAASKFREIPGFGTRIRGPLLLQDHGGEVWFRNLRVRDLKSPASGPP